MKFKMALRNKVTIIGKTNPDGPKKMSELDQPELAYDEEDDPYGSSLTSNFM